MAVNRISQHFTSPTKSSSLSTDSQQPITSRQPIAPSALTLPDIFRIAYELARRDYELNRLFNPEFYETE